jgi:hypothetical protein
MDTLRPAPLPIRAKYFSSGFPLHDENPLISALPPIRTDDQWIAQLLSLPHVTDADRAESSHLRCYRVSRLKRVFIPDSATVKLARRVDVLIRTGLESRNPRTPDRAESIQRAYERGQSGHLEPIDYSEEAPIASYSLVGVSGMGKSTGMAKVVAAFPKYIFHEDLHLHQVVWLKVETPKDGSVRELAMNILRAFDEVLGTNHVGTIPKHPPVNLVLGKVASLAATHCLGILVIDEIQNISIKRSGGREEVLNWVQELVNELRLPVILMGTPKARNLFDLQIRHARRAGTAGSDFWAPLELDSEFDLLLGQLWDALVLREVGPLTDEMRTAVHECTQGIKGFMADMLLVTQLHALRTEKETITPAMFRQVADTEFAHVKRFIAALRSKDPRRLARYEDICEYDVDEMIERTQSSLGSAVAEGIRAARGSEPYLNEAIRHVLSTLPIDEATARALVLEVAECKGVTSARMLTQSAIRLYAERARGAAAA